MCRNIKRLYNFEPPVTDDEIEAAVIQFVRKVSGMQKPSQANRASIDRAVAEITEVTRRLLREELQTTAAPRSREVEAQRARERGQKRELRMRQRILAEGD